MERVSRRATGWERCFVVGRAMGSKRAVFRLSPLRGRLVPLSRRVRSSCSDVNVRAACAPSRSFGSDEPSAYRTEGAAASFPAGLAHASLLDGVEQPLPVEHAHFAIDAAHVVFRRTLGYGELVADGAHGASARQQHKHLGFAVRETAHLRDAVAFLFEARIDRFGARRGVKLLHVALREKQHAHQHERQHADEKRRGARLVRPQRRIQQPVRADGADERSRACAKDDQPERQRHGNAPSKGHVGGHEHHEHVEAVHPHDDEPCAQKAVRLGQQQQQDEARRHGGDDRAVQRKGLGFGGRHRHRQGDRGKGEPGEQHRLEHEGCVVAGERVHHALRKAVHRADGQNAAKDASCGDGAHVERQHRRLASGLPLAGRQDRCRHDGQRRRERRGCRAGQRACDEEQHERERVRHVEMPSHAAGGQRAPQLAPHDEQKRVAYGHGDRGGQEADEPRRSRAYRERRRQQRGARGGQPSGQREA